MADEQKGWVGVRLQYCDDDGAPPVSSEMAWAFGDWSIEENYGVAVHRALAGLERLLDGEPAPLDVLAHAVGECFVSSEHGPEAVAFRQAAEAYLKTLEKPEGQA